MLHAFPHVSRLNSRLTTHVSRFQLTIDASRLTTSLTSHGSRFYTTDANCFRNLISFSNNNLISLILYLIIACLSIPIPHANPEYLVESIPQVSNTAGSTIPQPNISSQPVPFVIRCACSSAKPKYTSISALGSVKGK